MESTANQASPTEIMKGGKEKDKFGNIKLFVKIADLYQMKKKKECYRKKVR